MPSGRGGGAAPGAAAPSNPKPLFAILLVLRALRDLGGYDLPGHLGGHPKPHFRGLGPDCGHCCGVVWGQLVSGGGLLLRSGVCDGAVDELAGLSFFSTISEAVNYLKVVDSPITFAYNENKKGDARCTRSIFTETEAGKNRRWIICGALSSERIRTAGSRRIR